MENQGEPYIVSEVARKLATFHSEEMPINKDPEHLLRLIRKQRDYAYERHPIDNYIRDFNLTTLQSNNLDKELDWIRSRTAYRDSPVVFIHNDFRKPNVMVLKNGRVLFCDFEGSTYGHRGRDFGTFFTEWDRNVPEDYGRVQKFADDEVIIPFIEQYIKESVNIHGNEFLDDPRNCVKHILKETKLFALVAFLHMMTACLYIEYDGVPKRRMMVIIMLAPGMIKIPKGHFCTKVYFC